MSDFREMLEARLHAVRLDVLDDDDCAQLFTAGAVAALLELARELGDVDDTHLCGQRKIDWSQGVERAARFARTLAASIKEPERGETAKERG